MSSVPIGIAQWQSIQVANVIIGVQCDNFN